MGVGVTRLKKLMLKVVQVKSISLLAVLIGLLGVGVGAGYYLGSGYLPLQKRPATDYSDLAKIQRILVEKFDGNINEQKLLDGAKMGLAGATGDPYTGYLSEEAAKILSDDLSGTLSGIGAEIAIKDNKLQVVAPIAGSPAEKAGIRAGDQIQKINDDDTTSMLLDEAVGKIRGPKDTTVRLLILRNGKAPFELVVTRQLITIASVKWSLKEGNIGYIQISRFGDDSQRLLEEASDELVSKGASKFILDLRNNPGGYLSTAVEVAGNFLPLGSVVVEERRGEAVVDKEKSEQEGRLVGKELVVLINQGSASASEIVAGALGDYGVATLIGEKSFGKGSVQELVDLGGGRKLKVTTRHWFTPKGRGIDKSGITPDQSVKLEASDFEAGRDPQLDAAIAKLRGNLR